MADIHVATTRVACNTTTGDQTIRISGLTATPKAALFILSNAITDGTAADRAQFSIGATDGTREMSCAVLSRDADSFARPRSAGRTTKCILTINDNGTVDGEADFVSFLADAGSGAGVTINWSDAPPAAYLMTVVLFGGTDLIVRADTINLGTGTSAVTYSSLASEPDALIFFGYGANFASVELNDAALMIGLVHNNGAGTVTQRCMAMAEEDSADDGKPCLRMMEDKFGCELNETNGAVLHEYGASNFTSTGFDFTPSANSGSDLVAFLAFDFGGGSSSVGTYEPPTSATTSTISTSFTPQFCLLGLNGCAAVDTAEQDGDAGVFGVSAMDATSQYSTAIAIEDASATTDTQSMSDNVAVKLPAHDGASDLHVATLTSMNGSGVNLSFSTASATTRKWIYLAIGAAAGGGGGGISDRPLQFNQSIQRASRW